MARVFLDGTEIDVTEDVEDILNRIVNSRDGLRRGSGELVAPPGWMMVTEPHSGDPIYIQVARIGYVSAG
jgi:hypothetical protein